MLNKSLTNMFQIDFEAGLFSVLHPPPPPPPPTITLWLIYVRVVLSYKQK